MVFHEAGSQFCHELNATRRPDSCSCCICTPLQRSLLPSERKRASLTGDASSAGIVKESHGHLEVTEFHEDIATLPCG